MEKKQHLVALDLDGTLLTDDKRISERTKEIVQKTMAAGHIVVIATGRPHRASIQYYETLELNTPMINFNGAFIHHPRDEAWGVWHNPMPVETARKIVEAAYAYNVHNIIAEVQDHVYLDKNDERIVEIFRSTREDSPFTIGSLQHHLTTAPTSLLIHPRENHAESLVYHLQKHYAEAIEQRRWEAPWHIIEIVKKGMNKAVGLQKIAHHYHIPQERIIAFGDEDNDLEMIDYAGVGVAMNNALNELKSIADHITTSNEEDGVGTFLEQYFNLDVKPV